MDVYRDFLVKIRKFTLIDVFIVYNEDVVPDLCDYVRRLCDIKSEDGAYHVVCGEIKKILTSFITYYQNAIDDVILKADKFTHIIMNHDTLEEFLQDTLNVHQSRQIYFGRNFLPVQSHKEKEEYDQIEKLHDEFTEKLQQLKEKIAKIYKKDLPDFIEEHFQICVKKTSEIFDFTHVFISMILADRLNEIRICLEELLLRTRNNLKKIRVECEENTNRLVHDLYDKNKDYLKLSRQNKKSSVEASEVCVAMEKIRSKIKLDECDLAIERLEAEQTHWQTKLAEFVEIAGTLQRLRTELRDVEKEDEIYESLRCTELPGSKYQCWLNMGRKFKERKQILKDRIVEVARTLVTFFCARGMDRVVYTDHIGQFYVDEFKHKVYLFHHQLNTYHMTCDGDFKEIPETAAYYTDKYGRHTLDENGQKLYQCAPCTSVYRLNSKSLLEKVTADCGHAEKAKKECDMQINDPMEFEILPIVEQVDIKDTLDPETVEYLWKCFGHVLPQALGEVARARARNPIHLLAHKLLMHKYNIYKNEFEQKKKEAAEYRDGILTERLEKAKEESRKWKSKQGKRGKPEERDDSEIHDAFSAICKAVQNNVFASSSSI